MHILCLSNFIDFPAQVLQDAHKKMNNLRQIKELKISGCIINDFSFLYTMPAVERLYFLDCKSDVWQTLSGTSHVVSLGLHNLKQGKYYLDSTSFLRTFPQIEYLFVAMLGISCIPEVKALQKLHTVFGEFRNENQIARFPDFSSFRELKNFNVFNGWAAVDRHRVPAECFIPILQHPSLKSFTYTQMYSTENKKMAQLVHKLHPGLIETTLNRDQLMAIRREKFVR